MVVTSHLNLLKAYAASLPDFLNVSVGFDSATLQPTFELLYGVPGSSRALEAAARLGVDFQILDKAKTYLKESNRRILELIEDLQDAATSMRALKGDLTEILHKATRYEDTIQTLTRRIESKREDIFAQVERKGRALFREGFASPPDPAEPPASWALAGSAKARIPSRSPRTIDFFRVMETQNIFSP